MGAKTPRERDFAGRSTREPGRGGSGTATFPVGQLMTMRGAPFCWVAPDTFSQTRVAMAR